MLKMSFLESARLRRSHFAVVESQDAYVVLWCGSIGGEELSPRYGTNRRIAVDKVMVEFANFLFWCY